MVLVDIPQIVFDCALQSDPLFAWYGTPKKIYRGMYIGSISNTDLAGNPVFEEWPDAPMSLPLGDVPVLIKYIRDYIGAGLPPSYFVCDYPAQLVEKYPDVEYSDRSFVAFFTDAGPKHESGWRWHKQGEYIGDQPTQGCEYYHDEPDVDNLWFGHVWEINSKGT
jgi:hypothetical protein